jgi:hypothetical protein
MKITEEVRAQMTAKAHEFQETGGELYVPKT